MDSPARDFTLISWNIKGIGAAQKRRALQHIISHDFPDDCVIALQETHTDAAGAHHLSQIWPASAWTSASSASAGVGFIIKSSTGRIALDRIAFLDPEGRRIDVIIRSPMGHLRLSSIYAPTNTAAQKAFFKNVIPTDIDDVDIFAGDWNCVTRTSDSENFESDGIKGAPILEEMFEESQHLDVRDMQDWDTLWFTFTHVQLRFGTPKRRRLDRCYAAVWLATRVTNYKVLHHTLSDHRPVRIDLNMSSKAGRGL
jgi:exonuclease III